MFDLSDFIHKHRGRIPVFLLTVALIAQAVVFAEPVSSTARNQKKESNIAQEYAPTTLHTGDATWYTGTTGAANLDDMADTYYTAAMNDEDYVNGLAGAYVEVTDEQGDSVCVLITDRLPEGKKGDIDLSKKAFKVIEPVDTGRMKVSWHVIALPTQEPVSFLWKPTSSQYWAQVQVRHHRYPLKKLEYYDRNAGCFVEMKHEEYNYFTAPNGMGGTGPFTFRITDIYGQTITEKRIPMQTDGQPIAGGENFPFLPEQESFSFTAPVLITENPVSTSVPVGTERPDSGTVPIFTTDSPLTTVPPTQSPTPTPVPPTASPTPTATATATPIPEDRKQVSVWVIDTDFGKECGEGVKVGSTTFSYNKKGFLTGTYTKMEGDVDFRVAYIRNRLTYNEDDSIRCVKRITKKVQRFSQKHINCYDENGRVIKVKLRDTSGQIVGRREFEYDDDDRIAVVNTYLKGVPGLADGYRYTYNADGRYQTVVYVNSEGEAQYTHTFFYDSHGNISKVKTKYTDGETSACNRINTYKKGRLVRILDDSNSDVAVFTYKKIRIEKRYETAVLLQQQRIRENAIDIFTANYIGLEGFGINMDFQFRW